MSKEFKEALRNAREMYEDAKIYSSDVPEGQYKLQLLSASMAFAKTSGALMIKRQHQVLDGDHEGKHVFDNLVLTHVFGWNNAQKWMELCGYEVPDDPEEVEDVITGINEENPIVIARVTKSGEDNSFTNVHVIELLEESAEVEDDDDEEEKPAPKKGKAKKASGEFDIGDAVTFEDDDGGVTSGKIVDFEDDEAHVEDEEGEVWVIEVADLSKADKKEKKTKKTKKTKKKDEDDDTALLLAFCQAQGIDQEENVDEDTSLEDLVEILSEYEWDGSELSDGECELLDRVGVEYKKAKKGKKK